MTYLVRLTIGLIAAFTCAAQAQPSHDTVDLLTLNDLHLQPNKIKPMQLNPAHPSPDNDLDPRTFNQLIDRMQHSRHITSLKADDHVLLLGDLVGHGDGPDRRNKVIAAETQVFMTVPRLFNQRTIRHQPQIHYQFGNNDGTDADYGPFTSPSSGDNPWRVAAVASLPTGSHWVDGNYPVYRPYCDSQHPVAPCLFDPTQLPEARAHGLSIAYLKPHLALINFNNTPLSKLANADAAASAASVLTWLTQALQFCHQHHYQALIAMHIPFGQGLYDGKPFLTQAHEYTLTQLFARYHHDIIAVFCGHTHTTEFKVLRHHHRPKVVAFISPALSTAHTNAASFSRYHLQRNNAGRWQLMNMRTYRFTQQADIVAVMNMRKAYHCQAKQPLTDCIMQLPATASALQPLQHYLTNGNPNTPPTHFTARQQHAVYDDMPANSDSK